MPIDLQLKLFDVLISPTLTYGAEKWGFGNLKIIEKIHLQFCKIILGVRISTPKVMVYGETVRFSLEINIKMKMVSFWYKMVSCTQNKVLHIM